MSSYCITKALCFLLADSHSWKKCMQISRLIEFSTSARNLTKRSSSKRKVCGTITSDSDGIANSTSPFMKCHVFVICVVILGANGVISGRQHARLNQACASARSIRPEEIFFMKYFCSKCMVSSINRGRRHRIWWLATSYDILARMVWKGTFWVILRQYI